MVAFHILCRYMNLGPYKKNPNHQNHQNQQNHLNHQNHSMNQKNGSNNSSMPGTSSKSKPNDGKPDDNMIPKRKLFYSIWSNWNFCFD